MPDQNNRNFEEALADLIGDHLPKEGAEALISAMELQIMAVRETSEEAEK